MAKEKRVALKSPLSGHGELIREVVLREPRAADLWSIGEPFVWARNADGSMLPIENNDAIRTYIERCCASPDPLLLGGLSLADAMAVKEAVLGFFVASQATSSPPATSSSPT
jgi:hypothetical protein